MKVRCLSYDRRVGDRHHRRHKEATHKPANFEELLGTKSWVNSLYVWFPAAWMPLVVEAIEKKTCEFLQGNQQPGAVSCIADVQTLIGENREVCIRVQNWHAVEEKHCRILHARANVDYLLLTLHLLRQRSLC